MSNIDNRSQNVEQEEHANANNTTASEGALTPKSIFESCRKNNTKPHGFSKVVAEVKLNKGKLGWAAALVLRYLAYIVRIQGETFKGKEWVRINLDHIASQYPYLSRAGVDKAIARLIAAGACETRNLNATFSRYSFDRTRWYHVPKSWMDMAEKDVRYFYAPLASEIGVPAAVIYHNFMHWINERNSAKEEAVCKLMPATLKTLLPFCDKTIRRAITTLQDEELIFEVPGKQCLFAECPSRSKVDETRSKVDMGRSKVDKPRSKVDNNSYSRYFVDLLEESSKERPAVAVNALPCDKTNKGDKDTGLEHIEFLSPFETYVATDLLLPETKNDSLSAYDTKLQIIAKPDSETFTNSDTELALSPKFFVIQDFDHLHTQNRKNRGAVQEMTKDKTIEAMFQDKAHQLTAEFFYVLGKEAADDLYDNASDEELFNDLFPRYRDWFKSSDSELFDIFYYGVFECIIGAFRYATHGFEQLHPITCFIPIAYDQYCILLGRAEKRRVAAIEEEAAELQKQFASIDRHKEWEHDLSPAEKTRVFKQGLYSRNKIGWVCLGGERKREQIVINSKSLRDVEKLFELNRDACAGDLLRIMDKCMHLHATYPPVPKIYRGGLKWHTRLGHNLSMFTKHLETIVRQLDIASVFTRFLGDAMLEDVDEMDAEPELQEAA